MPRILERPVLPSPVPPARVHSGTARAVRAALVVLALGVIAAVTLLPVPAGRWACVAPQLDPTTVLPRIVDGGFGDLRQLLDNGALVQFVENVLLFAPLGALVASAARRRPVLLATAAGLLVSGAVEATQATGTWGLVACAYRVCDVSDLVANTGGALLGACLLLAARAGAGNRPARTRAR